MVMDYLCKQISFQLLGVVVFSFMNDRNSFHPFPTMCCRFLKAKEGRHLSFLASLLGDDWDKSQSGIMWIVSDFLDVFVNELPGLPPKREIEFTIDFYLGTEPISIVPYRMTPLELQELRKQLDYLLVI